MIVHGKVIQEITLQIPVSTCPSLRTFHQGGRQDERKFSGSLYQQYLIDDYITKSQRLWTNNCFVQRLFIVLMHCLNECYQGARMLNKSVIVLTVYMSWDLFSWNKFDITILQASVLYFFYNSILGSYFIGHQLFVNFLN